MTKRIRPAVFLASVITAIFITAFAIYLLAATPAQANPTSFPPSAMTATATTSVNYLTPGTATTTLVYDSYGLCGTNQPNSGNQYATDSATLLTFFTGSSTAAILKVQQEFSQDCINWYRDNSTVGLATTTGSVSLNAPLSYNWTFDQVAQGGAAGAAATTTRAVMVPMPTRATRFIITITGANGAIWAQVVPKKENK